MPETKSDNTGDKKGDKKGDKGDGKGDEENGGSSGHSSQPAGGGTMDDIPCDDSENVNL
jgi:hypothetical protein